MELGEQQGKITFGEFELHPSRRSLRRSGELVPLSAKAFDLLVFLAKNPGRVISKDELLDSVWKDQFVEQSNLTVQIHALRKALGETAGEPRFLATIPGRGYQFIASVTQREELPPEEAAAGPGRADPVQQARFWKKWAVPLAIIFLGISSVGVWYVLKNVGSEVSTRSIAILPFTNQTGDPGLDFLAEGLAESVIFSLSQVPDLKVLSRESSFRFRGPIDAGVIGQRLGVEVFLNGRISRIGTVYLVSTELVSADDNKVVWGEQFRREIDDIERLQGDIARAIARELRVTLIGAADQNIDHPQTQDHEAFQLFLAGRYHLGRLTDDGFLKARDKFQQAIDRDPKFVLAYAGLAEAHNLLSGWGAMEPNDGFPLAKAAALRALDLDPSSAEAHIQLGIVRLFYEFDWKRADTDFQRAIEINPGLSDAHHMHVYTLMVQRRLAEAEAAADKALALDPLALLKHITKGNVYFYARYFDKAIEQYRVALQLEPNSGLANWSIGTAFIFTGGYEDAIRHLEMAVHLSGDSPDEPVSLAIAHVRSGNRDEAKSIASKLIDQKGSSYIGAALLAILWASLGETDKAFIELETAVRQRDPLLIFMKVDPMFDPLRSDTRFEELSRRLDLP